MSQIKASGFFVRSEVSGFNGNEFSLISLNAGLKMDISELGHLRIFGGYNLYNEEYSGFNYSLLADKSFYKSLSVIFGLNLHSNIGISHGLWAGVESYTKSFLHYVIGVGYDFDKRLNIDFLFYLPENKEYGYSYYISDRTLRNSMNHNFTLKIGIEYYFIVFK